MTRFTSQVYQPQMRVVESTADESIRCPPEGESGSSGGWVADKAIIHQPEDKSSPPFGGYAAPDRLAQLGQVLYPQSQPWLAQRRLGRMNSFTHQWITREGAQLL